MLRNVQTPPPRARSEIDIIIIMGGGDPGKASLIVINTDVCGRSK